MIILKKNFQQKYIEVIVGCFLKLKMTTCSHTVEKWLDTCFVLRKEKY